MSDQILTLNKSTSTDASGFTCWARLRRLDAVGVEQTLDLSSDVYAELAAIRAEREADPGIELYLKPGFLALEWQLGWRIVDDVPPQHAGEPKGAS